jgi:hypothetical protein
VRKHTFHDDAIDRKLASIQSGPVVADRAKDVAESEWLKHLYPISITPAPIWQLVRPINNKLANALKFFLESQWQCEAELVHAVEPQPQACHPLDSRRFKIRVTGARTKEHGFWVSLSPGGGPHLEANANSVFVAAQFEFSGLPGKCDEYILQYVDEVGRNKIDRKMNCSTFVDGSVERTGKVRGWDVCKCPWGHLDFECMFATVRKFDPWLIRHRHGHCKCTGPQADGNPNKFRDLLRKARILTTNLNQDAAIAIMKATLDHFGLQPPLVKLVGGFDSVPSRIYLIRSSSIVDPDPWSDPVPSKYVKDNHCPKETDCLELAKLDRNNNWHFNDFNLDKAQNGLTGARLMEKFRSFS